MIYNNKITQDRKAKFKSIVNHPYFGFIVISIIMLVIYILGATGVIDNNQLFRVFGKTMINIIIALGFSILLGYAGLASLGTAGFVGVGTYIIGAMTHQLQTDVFIIILISLLGAIVLGAIVGFISLRIEGMYLAIITLGLSEILREVFISADTLTNGTNGLSLQNIFIFGQEVALDKNIVFVVILAVLLMLMIITFNLMKSPTGRGMLAMRNSQSAAQAMGVSIFKYRLLAFILATVFAVLGGLLYVSYFGFTEPGEWDLAFSLDILAAVIVGGSQSIYGIILGAFLIFGLDLGVLQQIPFFIENPAISIIFKGALIIIVIMFYPGGLIRLFNNLTRTIKVFISKLKKKRREYKYGKDPE